MCLPSPLKHALSKAQSVQQHHPDCCTLYYAPYHIYMYMVDIPATIRNLVFTTTISVRRISETDMNPNLLRYVSSYICSSYQVYEPGYAVCVYVHDSSKQVPSICGGIKSPKFIFGGTNNELTKCTCASSNITTRRGGPKTTSLLL